MKSLRSTLVVLGTLLALAGASQSVTRTYSKRDGEKFSYRSSNFVSSFDIETRGKIELTDDDKDIKSMSPDGYLEITKTVFGSKRTIVISPGVNGLKREYYEGRTSIAFEPEGRKWLSEVLPEVVRSSTLGAESRVNRFYRQGGTNAVLGEIKSLDGDYLKAHYANLLMDLNIPVKDYGPITTQVGETLNSDHYLTEFLKKNMTKFLQTKESTEGVFVATRKMDSDHYKTEVIKEALRSGPASLENVRIIMQATSNMESDHYKTEVLSALLRQNNLTDDIISEVLTAVKSMESDHYRTVVLKRALEKTGLSSTSFKRALEVVKDMDSDHYKTEVFKSLLENDLAPEVQPILIEAMSSVESDHYATIVGNEMMKKQNLTDESFQKLLEVMGRHDSDYYVATFLQAALERPKLTKQNILVILQAVGGMGSDHYITEVLVDAAAKINALNDASLKDAYRAAAKKIESETYYGRALRAID